jgi:dynein heavy chain
MHASISELVEHGVMDILEEINEISDCASREKKLEDGIQKMKDEWKYVRFELQGFRDSGTHVLKGAEPIWDMLDDHIMKTITIASSPYIKFLQSEVNYWKYTLVKVQEILEEWTKTQRGWLYLWPIFSSEDI